MCFERVTRGLKPACVSVCPTGTMNFGERDDMLAMAEKRLKEAKKDYPKAMLANAESVSVIYLLIDEPKHYHQYSVAQHGFGLDRKMFLAQLGRPFRKTLNLFADV